MLAHFSECIFRVVIVIVDIHSISYRHICLCLCMVLIQFPRCSRLRRTAKGQIPQDPFPSSLLIPKQKRNCHQGWCQYFRQLNSISSGDTIFTRFVLCWSHFQGSWDNVGPFHIYGSSGEPWFTARIWYWAEKGRIDLWGYFLTAELGLQF